ncbi:hypothetical protein P2318_18125 [Myxococcaceae bacterium GXIMD 01537]
MPNEPSHAVVISGNVLLGVEVTPAEVGPNAKLVAEVTYTADTEGLSLRIRPSAGFTVAPATVPVPTGAGQGLRVVLELVRTDPSQEVVMLTFQLAASHRARAVRVRS